MSEPSVKLYETRSGTMLALRHDQYVTRSLELYGEYCPDEWQALKQVIKPGMTVVEVGANMGAHSVDMARACAPGPFFAFEPQPRIFQILCANLALNDIANAYAHPIAIGETEGAAVVPPIDYGREGNFGGLELRPAQTRGITVRVRPIDGIGFPTLDVLKVDVEGFEPQVLRGARQTIMRCRPVIYIENDRAAQQQDVISLIAEMGYRLYWHTPPLFSRTNFKGVQENVFGATVSVNMFCIPAERGSQVTGLQQIDPQNWTSPVVLRR